jgi:hypothetical protein
MVESMAPIRQLACKGNSSPKAAPESQFGKLRPLTRLLLKKIPKHEKDTLPIRLILVLSTILR